MIRQTLIHLCLLGLLIHTLGCAGLSGFDRRTGPAYAEEIQSWRTVIESQGGNGMWLVNRGYRGGDDVVALVTGSAFPHAAILDLENGVVIEALLPGNVVTSLDEFLAISHRVALVRPEGWTPDTGNAALAKARSQLGKKYDFGGILGFPSQDRWYCSELATWCWGRPANRWGPWHIIHPSSLRKMGTVLFDSGSRDGLPDGPVDEPKPFNEGHPAPPDEFVPAPASPRCIPTAGDSVY